MTRDQIARIERRWAALDGRLPPEDRTIIADALRLAAAQYRRDADSQRAAGVERMAVGFTMQAKHAELLAEIIEL